MTQELEPALLGTFLEVLRHGGIGAAARATDLSQPAVTARVRKLEQILGTPLLTRSSQGVAPTPAGDRLADYARRIQSLLDEAAVEVSASHPRLGNLRLMASTTLAAHVLPTALAAFRGRYPWVPMDIRIGNTKEVCDAVRAGEVPLGLVEGHARAPGVHLEPWLDDEIVPMVGADSAWRPRSPEDLEGIPLLWREPGSGTRAVVARGLKEAGVRRRPAGQDLVLASSEAIVGAAAAGLGLAFLSRWTASVHLAAGRLKPVPALGLEFRRSFHWALSSSAPGGAAGLFLNLAQGLPLRPS
jgi:DNA-binding transcriptional LysR family regulator